MAVHDPIGDMLTKIRNALMVKHEKVDISPSKVQTLVIVILG